MHELGPIPAITRAARGYRDLARQALDHIDDADRQPDQALREQLGDLVETIPSGQHLPAFRVATGLLNEFG